MRRCAAAAAVLCLVIACKPEPPAEDHLAGLRDAFAAEPVVEVYRGLCDASAAAWGDAGHVIVAGDEENVLRVYRRGAPETIAIFPLDDFLEVDTEHPEADIEAAAVAGETIYWLTSHGRNKNAEPRPSRRRFFATTWTGESVETTGRPYKRLLQDLTADERYAEFELLEAARRAPKSPGGLNLEALAPWPGGALLIGVRNPIRDGLALAIPLLNPEEVVRTGAAAVFGDPHRLDLEGLGVRGFEPLGEAGMLIAAGPPAGSAERLYLWSGEPGATPQRVADLGLNIEGLTYESEGGRLFLASDDGTRLVGGTECKSTPDVADRSFRVRRVDWP